MKQHKVVVIVSGLPVEWTVLGEVILISPSMADKIIDEGK